MEAIAPGPDMRVALATERDRVRAYWLQQMLPAVARRWVWWSSIHEQAAAYNLTPAAIVGPQLATLNDQLDRTALQLAQIAVQLSAGGLVLQPWITSNEKQRQMWAQSTRLAVVESGKGRMGLLPQVLLGAWALAPNVFSFAVRAAVSAGVFVLGDAWLDARKAEGDANLALQQTRQKAVEAIAATTQRDPAAGAALANALQQADLLAGNPSAVDKLVGAVAGLTENVSSSVSAGGGFLPLLAAWYFLSRRSA